MDKLDGLAIPMIMGDWKLVIQALEQMHAANMAVDLDSVGDDEAAEICEEMDRLEGVIGYLKAEYEKEYGSSS